LPFERLQLVKALKARTLISSTLPTPLMAR
jgi:hypothetical protein